MQYLPILAIVFIFYGAEAGSFTNKRFRHYVITTRAMERERGAAKLPSAIVNAILKAIGKYSTEKLEVDEHLITASEVFSLLNKATDESFADTFLKIENDKLISALRGVWIVAKFASGHSKVQDAKTAIILRNITEGLEKFSDKVLWKPDMIFLATNSYGITQTYSDIGIDLLDRRPVNKAKINEISFNTDVVLPVNSTAWSMIAYLKENTAENKEQFLKYYNPHDYLFVGEIILRTAENDLRILANASGYDTTKFDQLRTKFLRYQFQLYIFEFFNGGLEGEDEIVRYPYHANIFKIKKNFLWDSFKRAWKEYNDKFFPLYVKENILKSVLDTSGGNNCDLAQSVVDQLKSKCARHKYAVIVSDGVSKPDQYAYYGYPERMSLKEEYNGKSVIAFMASTQNKKKKEAFYSQNRLGIIALDVTNKYNANNLHTLMDFGNNTDGYQTVVYMDRYNPCVRSDMNVSASLNFEVPSLKWGIWPSSETLSYFVVF